MLTTPRHPTLSSDSSSPLTNIWIAKTFAWFQTQATAQYTLRGGSQPLLNLRTLLPISQGTILITACVSCHYLPMQTLQARNRVLISDFSYSKCNARYTLSCPLLCSRNNIPGASSPISPPRAPSPGFHSCTYSGWAMVPECPAGPPPASPGLGHSPSLSVSPLRSQAYGDLALTPFVGLV